MEPDLKPIRAKQIDVAALKFSVIAWLPYRIVTALIAFLVQVRIPPSIELGGPISMQVYGVAFVTQGWLRVWLEPWYRWDTAWYILIARNGYQVAPETIIFPPVYPLLIRLFAPVFGNDYLVSAIFVANVACVVCLWLLYRLVSLDFGEDISKLAVILLLTFPVGFFLVAGYSESLFLALALGAWLAFRKKFVLVCVAKNQYAWKIPDSTIDFVKTSAAFRI